MNKTIFDMLSTVYAPIIERAAKLRASFEKAGYIACDAGFFNNHFVKNDDGFAVELYPIPVLKVQDVGEAGIDVDSTWVELKLPREQAVLLDFPRLAGSHEIEVYGSENYLDDFLNKQSDPRETAGKIENSRESEINVCFYFDANVDADEIAGVFSQITSKTK